MKPETRSELDDYYARANSWADERSVAMHGSKKIAWIVAIIAAIVALLEAIALLALTPLKTTVPHVLMVDRQTGYVQALDPAKPEKIAADSALTQSFLVQYVTARESYDIATVQRDFKKVALWSEGATKSQYVGLMQATNPDSPLASIPRNTVVETRVRSVSPVGHGTALVRFETRRRDAGGSDQLPQNWVSIIKYRYSNAPMATEERYINPLGFQVTSYRKDAETPPQLAGSTTTVLPNSGLQPTMPLGASGASSAQSATSTPTAPQITPPGQMP